MKIAVTNHAVDRYLERVEGAKGFERESVREAVRKLVEDGFAERAIRPHPTERDRRIIPFKSGESILYLSIGPNTTSFPADLAVIGVLFEHELTAGQVGSGVTLESVAPELKNISLVHRHPKYAVFVGHELTTIEYYRVMGGEELDILLETLEKTVPSRSTISVYKLVEEKPT